MEYTIFCGGVVGEEWRRAVVGDDDVVIGHDNVLSEDCFRVRALHDDGVLSEDWWDAGSSTMTAFSPRTGGMRGAADGVVGDGFYLMSGRRWSSSGGRDSRGMKRREALLMQ